MMAAGMTGTIKARSVPFCLYRSPRPATAPEAFRRAMTSKSVNPRTQRPGGQHADYNENADVRPEG